MKTLLNVLLIVVVAACVAAPANAADKKDPETVFKNKDKDSDGKLSLDEFKGKKTGEKATKAEKRFKKLDKDSDGKLTLEEFKAGRKKKKKDS